MRRLTMNFNKNDTAVVFIDPQNEVSTHLALRQDFSFTGEEAWHLRRQSRGHFDT